MNREQSSVNKSENQPAAGSLSRDQFEAAELAVRREIAARKWDPEELRLLDYFVERSLRLLRTAAYFRTYRDLGEASETNSHAHEALERLLDKKVLARLPLATSRWHWYGFNLNFLDWPKERKRPAAFWEKPALPFEPELEELLRENFVAGSLPARISADSDLHRGRDAGPAVAAKADKDGARTNSAPRSTCGDDSDTGQMSAPEKSREPGPARSDREVAPEDWERLKLSLARGTVDQDFPEVCTSPGYKGVPSQGTNAVPQKTCTPPGYTTNANGGSAKPDPVPPEGTPIASSALNYKAELALLFQGVRLKGTESYNEKVALALGWLQRVDRTGGLLVTRFREQWMRLCQAFPDYVLCTGPYVLSRQLELRGDVPKPLALLAKAARADGKMR